MGHPERLLPVPSNAVMCKPVCQVKEPLSHEGVAGRFDESTVAEVFCAESEAAYEHVADALGVLRLLQHQQSPMVDTDWQAFWFPGQVAQWRHRVPQSH
jgi:hypothetical protein